MLFRYLTARETARIAQEGGGLTGLEEGGSGKRVVINWCCLFLLVLGALIHPLSSRAEQASRETPRAEIADVARAKALARAGRHEAAIALLEARTRQAPRDVEALFLLAGEYARAGRDAKAIETYQLVSALRPELAEPHANLAAIHLRKGELEAAAREMRLYLEHDPDSPVAHANLAWIYARLALAHYRTANERRPGPALAARINALERMLPGQASPPGMGKKEGQGKGATRP